MENSYYQKVDTEGLESILPYFWIIAVVTVIFAILLLCVYKTGRNRVMAVMSAIMFCLFAVSGLILGASYVGLSKEKVVSMTLADGALVSLTNPEIQSIKAIYRTYDNKVEFFIVTFEGEQRLDIAREYVALYETLDGTQIKAERAKTPPQSLQDQEWRFQKGIPVEGVEIEQIEKVKKKKKK